MSRRWRGAFVLCIAVVLAASGAHAGIRTVLHELRGRVVYLDFWASWCVPCRESFPWMKSLERQYGRAGLSIVAINVNRHRQAAERFLRVFRPNFTVVFDPHGRLAKKYGIIGMPTSFLIDRHGKIRFTHVGFFLDRRAEYIRQVRELLAQK